MQITSNNLQFIVPVDIFFSNKNNVLIPDIIKSLEGIESISKQFHTVVNKAFDIDLASSSAYVDSLEVGSLAEKVLIALNFKNEKELEAFLHKFGKDHPMLKNTINVIFVGVVIYGLYQAAVSLGGETNHIEANNNVIININQPGLSGQEISEIIDKATVDKKAIAKAAIKLITPAKSDKEASITFKVGDQEDAIKYEISPETIAQAPTHVKEVLDEKVLHIENASVSIRATDLDKRNQGWAGIVSGIDHRLPITVSPNVNVKDLKDTTYVDVSIVYKRGDKDNDLRPVRIFIEKISAPAAHVNLAKNKLTQAEAESIENVETSSQLNLPI